jgi:tripartite-type tricarboxylate transporter receptor subunit TctC
VSERLARESIAVSAMSAEEFGAYMRAEMVKWRKVIQAVGARAE